MSDQEQRVIDREHLKALSIGYYIKGGVTILGGCFLLIYPLIFMSLALVPTEVFEHPSEYDQAAAHGESGHPASTSAAPINSKLFLVGIGGFFGLLSLLMISLGGLTIYAGHALVTHKRKTLIYVVAIFNLLSIPYGTTLGIFVFIVLARPTVIQLFDQPATSTPPALK